MPAGKRSLRRLSKWAIPLAGAAVVLAGAFFAETASSRAAFGLMGAALTLMSGFGLHDRVLPNERRLTALRAEVDGFISAVRLANTTGVVASQGRGEVATFHAACDDLVQRARHIGTVAASTHGLPPARINVSG